MPQYAACTSAEDPRDGLRSRLKGSWDNHLISEQVRGQELVQREPSPVFPRRLQRCSGVLICARWEEGRQLCLLEMGKSRWTVISAELVVYNELGQVTPLVVIGS